MPNVTVSHGVFSQNNYLVDKHTSHPAVVLFLQPTKPDLNRIMLCFSVMSEITQPLSPLDNSKVSFAYMGRLTLHKSSGKIFTYAIQAKSSINWCPFNVLTSPIISGILWY